MDGNQGQEQTNVVDNEAAQHALALLHCKGVKSLGVRLVIGGTGSVLVELLPATRRADGDAVNEEAVEEEAEGRVSLPLLGEPDVSKPGSDDGEDERHGVVLVARVNLITQICDSEVVPGCL